MLALLATARAQQQPPPHSTLPRPPTQKKIKSKLTEALLKAENKRFHFYTPESDGSAVALHCFVVYCNFSLGLFISSHASFYGAAFGARDACLSGYYSSIIFSARSQGPVQKEEKEGKVGAPLLLWTLMAPSNERRHSHTHGLVPRRSLLVLFLLPSALHSPVFLPSVKSRLYARDASPSPPPPPPSPPRFGIPHLPSATSPLLSMP